MPIDIREKPKIYMSNDTFKSKSVEEVYITHIVSPDKFFVRKVSTSLLVIYLTMLFARNMMVLRN